MKFMGLFDKLKIVFDLITNNNILMILAILIVATVILRLSNRINNKKMGIIIYLIESITFGVMFFLEKKSITTLGNNIIDNIFLNFYFPSIYIYLFIFIFSTVVFIYTLLNKFISKTYKSITNIYYFTFNFIFILLVSEIVKNNIDIFAKESLFTNNNTLALLELSTLLFFLYLIINILVYFTNYAIQLVENKRLSTSKVNDALKPANIEINIDRDNKEEKEVISQPLVSFNELVNKLEEINNNSLLDITPEFENFNTKNEEAKIKIDLVPEVKTDFKFIDPILFNDEKDMFIVNENSVKEKINIIDLNIINKKEDDKISLNDYKLFSRMLKTVIENNNSSKLGMSDILNKNLLNKYSEEEYNKFKKILNSCLN